MARLYRSTGVRPDREDTEAVPERGRAASSAASADEIAIAALSFVASDPELLPRFLAITGIEPQAIRRAASEPGFLAGVLQFVLAHEPTLMKFAAESGIAPVAVGRAAAALPLGDPHHERSI